MARARAAQEEGTIFPRTVEELSYAELIGHFDLVTKTHAVTAFGRDDGKLRLSVKLTKAAFDHHFGRMKRPRRRSLPQDDALSDGSEDVRPAIELSEAIAALREVTQERLDRSKPDTGRWHVLQNLEELLLGTLTLEALAKKTGLTDGALSAALKVELTALRRRLPDP